MDPHTIHQESGPGWRELVEALHEQLEAAREREATLLKLLQMDREALVHLSRTGRPRPNAARPSSEPLPLHRQILEALASQPAGLTRAQIEAAMGTDRPLADVLRGLWRRGRLARVGQGRYALPGHNETGPPAKEMSHGQIASQ
jgi:hypothetical protein